MDALRVVARDPGRLSSECLSLSKTRTSSGLLSSMAHVLPVSFVRSSSSIGKVMQGTSPG